MKVIVTAGPSFEPIDEVRRLTNFSTGELGVLLANRLAAAGCEVVCLKGVGTTYPGALAGRVRHLAFTTNQNLHHQLIELSETSPFDALFHVAALCDFQVASVQNPHGKASGAAKIDSRAGPLILHLEPAPRVISDLRRLFPKATLVGWKYELVGTRENAFAKAWQQLRENHTDACVLNGQAYGNGFAICTPPGQVRELADKHAVAEFLVNWLERLRANGRS